MLNQLARPEVTGQMPHLSEAWCSRSSHAANPCVWWFGRQWPDELRPRARLNLLFKLVGERVEFCFLKIPAIHPDSCRFSLCRQTHRERDIGVAGHRRRGRSKAITRRDDGIEMIALQGSVDSFVA